MAWEYFTDWLPEGSTITSDQVKELVDAVNERAGGIGWLPDGDNFQRNIFTRSIKFTGTTAPAFARQIHWMIGEISRNYFRHRSGDPSSPSIFFELWTPSNLWTSAYANLPPSARPTITERPELLLTEINSPNIYNRYYWNLCRSAVKLLKWPVFPIIPTGYLRRVDGQGSSFDWETVIADFCGTPETISGVGVIIRFTARRVSQGPIYEWQFIGRRITSDLFFPANPYGNGPWDAWTRARIAPQTSPTGDVFGNATEFIPSQMELKVGSEIHNFPLDDYTEDFERYVIGNGITSSGNLGIEMRVIPYPSTNEADYDDWKIIPSPGSSFAWYGRKETHFELEVAGDPLRSYLATTPTFTHT